MTDSYYKIADLPAGSIVDQDPDGTYYARLPDGSEMRFTLVLTDDGLKVVKTIVAKEALVPEISVGSIETK
jgi:hypothetical protein